MVCGTANTVKSHLVPRALIHDIRKTANHVISLNVGAASPRFRQSGEWRSDILCADHEASLQRSDDYAVEFCRDRYPRGRLLADGEVVIVDNADPPALVKFAHSAVWRYLAADIREGKHQFLGPYFKVIEDAVFSDGPPLPSFLIDPQHVLGGRPLRLAMSPVRHRVENVNLVRFEVGGLAWLIVTDKRPPPAWFGPSALERDQILVARRDPTEFLSQPGFRDSIKAFRAQFRSAR